MLTPAAGSINVNLTGDEYTPKPVIFTEAFSGAFQAGHSATINSTVHVTVGANSHDFFSSQTASTFGTKTFSTSSGVAQAWDFFSGSQEYELVFQLSNASYQSTTSTSTGSVLGSFSVTEIAAVPEPSTIVAGALLLLPFGASAFRVIRKNRTV